MKWEEKEASQTSGELFTVEEGLFCLLFLLTGHAWSARLHGWKSEFPHAAAESAPLNADLPGYVPVLQLACHYGLQLLANSEHC